MKRIISETFHFELDDSRDVFARREIADTIGILGNEGTVAGSDEAVASAFNAIKQNDFTLEQFLIASFAILAALQSREERHLEQEASEFSAAVIEQTRVARRRFKEALAQVIDAMGDSRNQKRDGFEKFRNPGRFRDGHDTRRQP